MKTVVITGSARGIGAASAALFADYGYKVVINYNTSEAEAAALLDVLKRKECNAIAVQADVSDPQEAQHLFDKAKEAVSQMAEIGVINGYNGNFMPKNNITRAEAAAMIVRALDLI